MDTLPRLTIPGILLLLTLSSGFRLSGSGKPYGGLLFNVHKLAALGAVVIAVMQLSKALKGVESLPPIVVLLVLAGICVIVLFASGALMSMDKLDDTPTLTIHRIASVVMAIAIALVGYWLVRKP
jgi:hypothetical protein